MPSLPEVLTSDAKKQTVVDDCVHLIDDEVKDKGGLTGLAIKAGLLRGQGRQAGLREERSSPTCCPSSPSALDPIYQEALTRRARSRPRTSMPTRAARPTRSSESPTPRRRARAAAWSRGPTTSSAAPRRRTSRQPSRVSASSWKSTRADPVTKLPGAGVLEDAAAALDDAARAEVVLVAGDEEALDAEAPRFGEHRAKHGGGVAAQSCRRTNVVADVAAGVEQVVGEPVPHADATEVLGAVAPPPSARRDPAFGPRRFFQRIGAQSRDVAGEDLRIRPRAA